MHLKLIGQNRPRFRPTLDLILTEYPQSHGSMKSTMFINRVSYCAIDLWLYVGLNLAYFECSLGDCFGDKAKELTDVDEVLRLKVND